MKVLAKCAVDPKQPFNEQAARHLMPRFELVVGSSSSEESDLGSDSDSDSVGMQTAFDIRSISNVQLEKYAMRLLVDEVRVFIEEWEGKKSRANQRWSSPIREKSSLRSSAAPSSARSAFTSCASRGSFTNFFFIRVVFVLTVFHAVS